jgi:hypothetical protein
MTMTIQQAIDFLEGRGFMVRGYGYPESLVADDTGGVAETYRVLQGDFDTGMIDPFQIVKVAERIRENH